MTRLARSEVGQAAVEMIGAAGVLALAGLAAFHILAAGYALTVADGAAEAAALAAANGQDPRRAAAEAAPGWPRRAIRVRRDGGSLTVTLTPPGGFGALRDRLAVTGEAWVRRP